MRDKLTLVTLECVSDSISEECNSSRGVSNLISENIDKVLLILSKTRKVGFKKQENINRVCDNIRDKMISMKIPVPDKLEYFLIIYV
jgi:hypothetical protein